MFSKDMVAQNAKYNNPKWIGFRNGMLTVTGIVHATVNGNKKWLWRCKCDCGGKSITEPWSVINGHSLSCGCMKEQNRRTMSTKHGESSSRLYVIWNHMRVRCDPTKKHVAFHERYAGRGIRVCDDWQDYETFARWARANGYNDNMTIERIDNDGDYCPENCKWIKMGKQARNRSTTLYVEYQGRRMSLAEACEISGMKYKTAFSRIKYWDWPVQDALETPLNAPRKWKRSERFCKRV